MKVSPFIFMIALAANAAVAQGIEVEPLDDPDGFFIVDPTEPEEMRQRVAIAPDGLELRALDKVSGEIVDFSLEPGQTKQLGRIQVTLSECRYPETNPFGDAYAYLAVRNAGEVSPVFSGWMIASSPALNALDHPRYDVWPLRCMIPSAD